jgi:hypothetical protein
MAMVDIFMHIFYSYYLTHMGPHGCWYTGAAVGVTGSGAAVDHDPAPDGHGGGYHHPYLLLLLLNSHGPTWVRYTGAAAGVTGSAALYE